MRGPERPCQSTVCSVPGIRDLHRGSTSEIGSRLRAIVDRHQIWRTVAGNYRSLELSAPAGYEPLVEVFLSGRTDPVTIGSVETSRADDEPWTILRARHEGDDTEDTLVFVRQEYVQRVEIRFVKKGRAPALGFSHLIAPDVEPLSDETASSDE
jgi:hypothetical protein